jgi:protocatechuate 3,4-dioxygenase alpha subunit
MTDTILGPTAAPSAGGVTPSPGLTPSQTVGPFFLDCLLRPDARRNVIAAPATPGARIRVEGHILDGDGLPVPDAVVEIWQADAQGRYRGASDTAGKGGDATFVGFGRAATDDTGVFWFETIKPGPVPFDAASAQAPHLGVIVGARGLLNHLVTRMYFADDPATAADPVLARVPADRRATLLGQPERTGGLTTYRWDIILQGVGETVFFNV